MEIAIIVDVYIHGIISPTCHSDGSATETIKAMHKITQKRYASIFARFIGK